jgi:YHS domain-containing protein
MSRIAFYIPKQFNKEGVMKFTVIGLTMFAAFSLSGLALAEDTASTGAAVEQSQVPAVAVGNTRCPVCGMEIAAEELGKYTAEYNGKSYNVCSPSDKDMFLSQPDRYSKIADTGSDPYKEPVQPKDTIMPPADQQAAPAEQQ